jgi:hypothetical protein
MRGRVAHSYKGVCRGCQVNRRCRARNSQQFPTFISEATSSRCTGFIGTYFTQLPAAGIRTLERFADTPVPASSASSWSRAPTPPSPPLPPRPDRTSPPIPSSAISPLCSLRASMRCTSSSSRSA